MRAAAIEGIQRCAILGAMHRFRERYGPNELVSTSRIARRLPWTVAEVRRRLEVMGVRGIVVRNQVLSRTDRWRLPSPRPALVLVPSLRIRLPSKHPTEARAPGGVG